jgi:hypothetical protein
MDSERGARIRLHSPAETEIMQGGPHIGISGAALSPPSATIACVGIVQMWTSSLEIWDEPPARVGMVCDKPPLHAQVR